MSGNRYIKPIFFYNIFYNSERKVSKIWRLSWDPVSHANGFLLKLLLCLTLPSPLLLGAGSSDMPPVLPLPYPALDGQKIANCTSQEAKVDAANGLPCWLLSGVISLSIFPFDHFSIWWKHQVQATWFSPISLLFASLPPLSTSDLMMMHHCDSVLGCAANFFAPLSSSIQWNSGVFIIRTSLYDAWKKGPTPHWMVFLNPLRSCAHSSMGQCSFPPTFLLTLFLLTSA